MLRRSAVSCTLSVASGRLIREGNLPATQAMWAAPWKVPTEALATVRVLEGVRAIKADAQKLYKQYQRDDAMRLPGI